MTQSEDSTFRVFDTRESKEYQQVLSEILSINSSSTANYPDLITSSYQVEQGPGSNIERVINIDYIGMAATVLLDKEQIYTRNAHYDLLSELLSSLDKINESGVALKVRILLQYPYSLAGQNRILSEFWSDRAFMGEPTGRDVTKLAPSLTVQLIENSALLRAQQDCLENLQHLLHLFKPGEPNKVEIRFAFVSTLICGLRVNKLFFYDPYHYGRQSGKRTCAYTSNPVVMIDGSNHCSAYEAFCNHFRVIWECDSTLDYDDVAELKEDMTIVMIRRPEKLDTSHKTRRIKELYSKSDDWEKERKGQLYRLVNRLCPIIPPVNEPEVGFLAAAWERKRDGSHGPCVPAIILGAMFDDGFKSLNHNVRVSILQSDLGASLSRSLFSLMDAATFSIILLTGEIEGKFCKPNIYVELGYLLNKNRKRRTFIVVEDETSFPTDLSDIVFTQFKRNNPQSIDEMKRVCKKLLEAMERVGIINENTLKELLDNWLPRWKPSANLLREIGNYFEQQQSVHKANGKESASQIRVEVSEEPITALEEHASIPIAFEVDSVLDVQESGNSPREFLLTERRLEVPYIKDYDAIEGGQPQQWARRFDVSNWGLLAARVGGLHVGGAVIAFNTPGLTMLEGRHDLAVLWDIRVSPEARGRGIGSALFRAAEVWARERGCRGFKVETQNINVRACRFYERQGCTLRAIDRAAYPKLPDEIQMLWYKLLSDSTPSG